MSEYSRDLSDFHSRIRQMFQEARTVYRRPDFGGPFVYGYTMRFAKDGQPVAEEFGNVSPYGIAGYMEPVTDVIERSESVSVVVELPGVKKEDIDLRTSVESVFLSVDTPFRKYMKDVRLSSRVRPETAVARYNNGVLEVTLMRAEDAQAGRKVKVQ
jgi:HSP20 family protein